MKYIVALLLACMASVGVAQDRDGNDTPGEWVVTHQAAYGLWDVFCDERTTGDLTEERCYIRYVEVFSARPKFGAMFVFVTGAGVEFGMEAGTVFPGEGPQIIRDDAQVWVDNRLGCRTGLTCTMDGEAAQDFLNAARGGGVLQMTFTDRHGAPQDLRWDLTRFDAAFADWRAQSAARDLPRPFE
ncbi:hypothetical protein AB3Y40_10815 [Yoonia sp. R2331]|uniref:hypothetical protein n=1 Tax=Yoonia sp. R2331 TaxID=3237238 RepID=UPI0034E5F8CC